MKITQRARNHKNDPWDTPFTTEYGPACINVVFEDEPDAKKIVVTYNDGSANEYRRPQ